MHFGLGNYWWLLAIEKPRSIFYENISAAEFAPKITLPTRICDTASTLIDNIYTMLLISRILVLF